ncbi:MAG: hypothetical protein ACJAUG_001165 [Halioglobus sp.]|jgi:hypothetical protein
MGVWLAGANEEVFWTDSRQIGYIRLLLSLTGGIADYIAVSTVGSQKFCVEFLRRVPLTCGSLKNSRVIRLAPSSVGCRFPHDLLSHLVQNS